MSGPSVLDPELLADPYDGYGRLRERAPVLEGRTLDGSAAWLVTRQDDVRAVLADPRIVTSTAAVPGSDRVDARTEMMRQIGVPDDLLSYLTGSILDADGADHTRLRKLVSRSFTVGRVASLRPRVEEITRDLLGGMDRPGEIDLIAELAYPLPITVICELVGVDVADRPAWRGWGEDFVSMDPARITGATRAMVDAVDALVALRRAEPRDDLLSGMIEAQEGDDRLTDQEIATMVVTLVFAGHETTAHLIGNSTHALLTHPDQLALLRADPGLWPGAVHELMRRCGPIQLTRVRYATDDLELGGVTIRRGDAVQPVLVSANLDPRCYADPDRLDVTRRPAGRGEGHVGFGHGPHYCLGAALARQEGEVALSALVTRFPDLALVGADPEWVPLPGTRRLARLPVRTRP